MSTAATVPGEAPKPIQAEPQPALPASTFKNEGKDVTGDALASNELGQRNAIKPPAEPAQYTATAPSPAPVKEPAAAAPTPEPTKPAPAAEEPPKLLAGKYKSVEELEKGYLESQKGFSQKVQSEVEKQLSTKVQEGIQAKLRELTGEQQVTQAIQAVKSFDEMSADEHLDLLTKDPIEYNRRQQQQILNVIRTSQSVEEWNRENADLKTEVVEGTGMTGEALVNLKLLSLVKANPERTSDYRSLLSEATGHVRNFITGLKNQGKQEGMVIRETVAPLAATVASTTAPAETAQSAPAKKQDIDETDEHVEYLRRERKRVSGGQPLTRL